MASLQYPFGGSRVGMGIGESEKDSCPQITQRDAEAFSVWSACSAGSFWSAVDPASRGCQIIRELDGRAQILA
jgi:hypothetical protein